MENGVVGKDIQDQEDVVFRLAEMQLREPESAIRASQRREAPKVKDTNTS